MRTLALALVALTLLPACGGEQGSNGMTIKIPHLIAYAGTPQEQDLGPFVDFDHYWSKELDEYVAFDSARWAYDTPDCAGAPSLATVCDSWSYNNGPDGTVIRCDLSKPRVTPKSWMGPDGCGMPDATTRSPSFPFTDTKVNNVEVDGHALSIHVR